MYAGIGLAGLTLAQGLLNYSAQKRNAENQRKIGEINASNILAETVENRRRTELNMNDEIGTSEAIVGASNVGGVSRTAYLSQMESERDRRLNWITSAGASRADAARLGASAAASSSNAMARASLLKGITGAYSVYRKNQLLNKTK